MKKQPIQIEFADAFYCFFIGLIMLGISIWAMDETTYFLANSYPLSIKIVLLLMLLTSVTIGAYGLTNDWFYKID